MFWLLCVAGVISKTSKTNYFNFLNSDLKCGSTSECFMTALADHEKIFLLVINEDFYSQRQFKYFRFTCQTNMPFLWAAMAGMWWYQLDQMTASRLRPRSLWVYWGRTRLYNCLLCNDKPSSLTVISISSLFHLRHWWPWLRTTCQSCVVLYHL